MSAAPDSSRLDSLESGALDWGVSGRRLTGEHPLPFEAFSGGDVAGVAPVPPSGPLLAPAFWVSVLLNPPLASAAAILLAARAGGDRLPWTALLLLLAVFAPLAHTLWLHRSGRITDLDISARHERLKPLFTAAASLGLAWLLLRHGVASALMMDLATAFWLQTLFLLAVLPAWRLSLHVLAVVNATLLLGGLTGLWPALILIPLVAASRLRLRRHTPLEVVGGALTGLAGMLPVLVVHASRLG